MGLMASREAFLLLHKLARALAAAYQKLLRSAAVQIPGRSERVQRTSLGTLDIASGPVHKFA